MILAVRGIYIQYGNVTDCGVEDTFAAALRFTRLSAGWSFLTHGELLPGRGLQPGQGAGRVRAERR